MHATIIEQAYKEDRPQGDLTTDSIGLKEKYGRARLIAKQDLCLSGQEIFDQCLHHCDPELKTHWYFENAQEVLEGQTLCQISGNLIQLIQAERVALNFLGYLSGIATQTRSFVHACGDSSTRILDTRKTLPLYRELSKKAVVHGGGHNHRMNLSDAVLIKENHIRLAEGFSQCVAQIKAQTEKTIEVETTNREEVKQAVALKVDRIMLDNMNLQEMKECLTLIPATIKTEASGNMTLERVPQVAALGVDFISVGSLTHSVKNADMSLLFDWN